MTKNSKIVYNNNKTKQQKNKFCIILNKKVKKFLKVNIKEIQILEISQKIYLSVQITFKQQLKLKK